MASLLEPLRAWADRQPEKVMYAFLDIDGHVTESYTYAQFYQRTGAIAAHIRRVSRLEAGARVLLVYPPGVEMICAFFACVRLGLIPVPAYPPHASGFRAASNKLDHIARDCQAAAVLTSRPYYWSMRLTETRHAVKALSLARGYTSQLTWIVSADADTDATADVTDTPSPVLFLQYTSGSTSEPRGVMVTHDNVFANCRAVLDGVPIGVSWLPQYHDMGLIGFYLFVAITGGTNYGMSPLDFLQRPALWFEAMSRYRATASSAPNFAYEYCLRPDKLPPDLFEHLDLSSLQALMTAAEPVRPDVCRAFVRTFEPYGLSPHSFSSAYGLAEFTLAVSTQGLRMRSFDRAALARHVVRAVDPGTDGRETTTLVSCGTPHASTHIAIVDVTAAPREVAPGRVGEIWIRGPSKCGGYWGRPALTAAVFEARLAGEPPDAPTRLRSGDLGFMLDNELYVCGRLKDLLIVRGLNYYPQDIEALVEADSNVRKGGVAAVTWPRDQGDTLVVVAELTRPDRVPDARAMNLRLVRHLGLGAAAFVFIKARTIPKTSSGKIVRHVVRERWLANELEVLQRVDVTEEMDDLADARPRAWCRRFGLSGDEPWTLAEAGFDSVKMVEFAQTLRDELARHGDHDLAQAADVRVLDKIAICELLDLCDDVARAAPHARLRLKHALTELGRQHRTAEAEQMRCDARLRPDIAALVTQAASTAHTSSATRDAEDGVLLTGATGFFGPFLLASLLEQHHGDIYVLVRGDVTTAMQRLRTGLAAIAADGQSVPPGWELRVRPVAGDLTYAHLGLDGADWRRLTDNVQAIFHNGAVVNYLFDYHTMRDANVGGTHEVIRLAASGRAKVLNYISTTFVFGWSVQETLGETDTNARMERLDFGYSQSKWVAEQVVLDAMRLGLPARIFRPALLTPSVHGGGSNFDIAIRLLAFMMNHGLGTTAQNQVSFTPADVAAANIVAIAGVPGTVGETFHVTRDAYASMADITALLSELTGRTFQPHALPTFVPEIIRRCHPGDILFPLKDFLVRSVDNISAMEFKRYDNSRYRHARALSPFGQSDPPLREVVSGILRFMRRHALVTD